MLVLTANLQEKAACNDVGSRKLVRFVAQPADLEFIEMAQFGPLSWNLAERLALQG